MSGGERTQIAQIAIELSARIFPAFGWTRTGTTDHNFLGVAINRKEDEKDEATAAEETVGVPAKPESPAVGSAGAQSVPQLQNYPADAVYHYPDPYYPQTTFIHFDFKSYAEGTIKPRTLSKDLQRLADVVSVADTSEDWIKKFSPEKSNYNIHGALFVHNHDEKALERFNTYLGKLTSDSIKLARDKRVFVFTPSRIIYLNSIVSDIDVLRGKSVLPRPEEGERLFFYPYGVRYKPQSNLLPYATAEALLAPLLTIRYRFTDPTKGQGYVIYYDGPGSESDEFTFIFESLLKRRLLTSEDKITIRMMQAVPNGALVFKKAKEDFVQYYHDLPMFRTLLDTVEYSRMDMVRPSFSTIELGDK